MEKKKYSPPLVEACEIEAEGHIMLIDSNLLNVDNEASVEHFEGCSNKNGWALWKDEIPF